MKAYKKLSCERGGWIGTRWVTRKWTEDVGQADHAWQTDHVGQADHAWETDHVGQADHA